VLFHDGAPFTSADVVASAAGFTGGVVQARGPHQVVFRLDTPDPSLPMRLADPSYYIAAAHAMGQGIGTGLYRVTHFAPGQQLLTERVDAHYKDGSAGWFDEVELVSIPAQDVRAQALGTYMIDAADLTDAAVVAGLPDVITLPDSRQVQQAASRDLGLPQHIGAQRPMDNLRAAERWWFS